MAEKADYEIYMRKCISLAAMAKERGDSPVGAVLVRDGEIIAEGIEVGKTHKDITYHAEIEAIRNAIKKFGATDLSECIMVTTHEPCIMCSYVIRHHKIKQVVVGVTTGEIGGYSSSLPVLLDKTISTWTSPPEVILGILEQECRELKGNNKPKTMI